MPLSEEAKLNFLRDYMIRSRYDAMQDKTALTQLFQAKLLILGGAIPVLGSKAGLLAAICLPFILISIDYLHKKRFLEIFARWDHSAEQCVKAARAIDGFWKPDEFEFLEERISRNKKTLADEESAIRLLVVLITLFVSAPAFALAVHKFCGVPLSMGIGLMLTWVLFVFIIFWVGFISSEKFQSTYPNNSWSAPVGLALLVGVSVLLRPLGFDVLDIFMQMFP
jgi:uncharacterized membrane protein YhaH (DUF805 family)